MFFLAYFINAQCTYRNAVVFSSWISIPNTAFLNVLLVFPHDHSIMWTTWGKRCNQIFNQGLVSIKKEKWVCSNQWPCTERSGHIYIFLCVCMQVYTCYVLSLTETDMKQNIFFITPFFKRKKPLTLKNHWHFPLNFAAAHFPFYSNIIGLGFVFCLIHHINFCHTFGWWFLVLDWKLMETLNLRMWLLNYGMHCYCIYIWEQSPPQCTA